MLAAGLLPGLCTAETAANPPQAEPLLVAQTPARFLLQRVNVKGASVLDAVAIQRAAQPWLGQMLGTLELASLAQALTQAYQAAGYEGSTVVLADQVIADGTVTFEARELFLSQIEIPDAPGWVRPGHIRRSFQRLLNRPLHVPSLRSLMIQLRESGLYERLDAEVQLPPDKTSGARLSVVAQPAFPMQLELSSANNRNPSIGARRDEVAFRHASLTGHGDLLDLRAGRTEGLDDWQLRYELPLPQYRLRMFAQATRSSSIAIEPSAFRELDIRSTADTNLWGAQFALRESAEERWLVMLQGERRSSLTTLLGIPFSFNPGLPDAEARSRAIRVETQWSRRTADLGWAARATVVQGRVADTLPSESPFSIAPRYRILQAGLEGAWRPAPQSGEWRLRMEAQHTRDVLLPADRMSLGGAASVRGYRENTALRDTGLFASLEWRGAPWVWRESLSVTPGAFVDAGSSRNVNQTDDGAPRRLASAGLMLETAWKNAVQMKIHWARAKDRTPVANPSLQDRGIHLALRIALP